MGKGRWKEGREKRDKEEVSKEKKKGGDIDRRSRKGKWKTREEMGKEGKVSGGEGMDGGMRKGRRRIGRRGNGHR